MTEPRQVAAAVLLRGDHVLVAERPASKKMAGFWEFPGGKLERGESPLAALTRELAEELALTLPAEGFEPFLRVNRDGFVVDFYLCHLQEEIFPQALEGQRWQWLPVRALSSITFLPSNEAVLARLSEKFS